MRRLITILAFLAATTAITHAQSKAVLVISPGIKIGSASGATGGFILGVELSAGFWNEHAFPEGLGGYYFGAVIDYDFSFNGRGKLHVGAEGTLGFLGVEAGPTLVFENGERRLATTITGFLGFGYFIPYYGVTFGDRPTITEWGAYFKGPYRADDETLFDFTWTGN